MAGASSRVTPSTAQRRSPTWCPPTKGVDGTRAGANEIVGSASGKTGMHALQDVDLFNLLSIPETYDMTDLQAAAVIPAAVDLCEKRRAFYIVDAPAGKARVAA